MSIQVFQDKIFPRQVSDLMNVMYMMVFKGTDGEEKWDTFLDMKQKEFVALCLAQYYQCQHCIEHHTRALLHLEKHDEKFIHKNVRSIVLFLRIDTRMVSGEEKAQWIDSWKIFSKQFSQAMDDQMLPHLVGLGIGIARNDEFLIEFCGGEVCRLLEDQGIDSRAAIGELEAVVIFMKAAASKNRVVDKVGALFQTA